MNDRKRDSTNSYLGTGPDRRMLRVATITHFVWDDGHRLAVDPDCPWCGKTHSYLVPAALATDAPLVRDAKCHGLGGRNVRLVLPDDGSTAYTETPDPGVIDLDTDLRSALRRFRGRR